jgi:hypothetical protein
MFRRLRVSEEGGGVVCAGIGWRIGDDVVVMKVGFVEGIGEISMEEGREH